MILVTGSTGLLGSHLLFHLAKRKEPILAMRRTQDISDVYNVFKFYSKEAETLFNKITWVDGDITDIGSMEIFFNRITHVYHSAAIISFDPKEKKKMLKVNIQGTANVINLSILNKVKKFCYVSSIAALGSSNENGLVTENSEWNNDECTSTYSLSKHLAELEVWRGEAEGLSTVIINPSTIIGPSKRDSGTSLIFKTALSGNKYYPLGSNGFVDVNDVAKIMIRLMNSSIAGEQFIVTSENLLHKKVAEMVSKALEQSAPYRPVTPFLGALAWRIEKLKFYLTGKPPLITKEILREASSCVSYSNLKLLKEIKYKYSAIEESIEKAAKFYLD